MLRGRLEIPSGELANGFVADVLPGKLGPSGGGYVTLRDIAQGRFGLGVGSIQEGVHKVQGLRRIQETSGKYRRAPECCVVVDVAHELRLPEEGVDLGWILVAPVLEEVLDGIFAVCGWRLR